MNNIGDLILTWSRLPTVEVADQLQGLVLPMNVTAVDNLGTPYESLRGCKEARRGGSHGRDYIATTLKRESSQISPGIARTVTLTVQPAAREPYADQVLVFPNIPLPPRQEVDDLFAAETEVIQY
jgi:hypothetical protein